MDIYLDKLELHGFKSFPEKTVIKFHKGITAVIGPNGCGKSNLVDAVLWVLGEQRIKNLRGDNNEDLIFNGSSSKKPLGMTEVGSFFSNKGESVYIARRFFRTGESKYILNDKYCRNKDIQNALFNMQLGGRGYFIFEQGSIEKMVSLKPSERRILIEEAAGISQYLERKKETANKLIIAEQNLENLDILSADKENRLKELKNQVNYVQRYRKIKEERQDYLKTYLRKRFETYQTGFEKLKSQVEKLLNQETILVKDVTLAEKNLLDFEQNRWDIDNNLKINQRKIFEINRNLTACQGEIEKLEQRQEFINQKITEMKNADKNGQAEIQQLEQQLNQSQKIYKEIAEQLKKEKISCSDFKVHLVELNTRTKTREKDDSEIKEQLFIFRSRLSQTKNKIQDIDKKMIRVEYDISTKQKFFLELKEQINENDINEAKKILADKTKEYQAQAGMFQKEEKEYQAIVANTETLKSTLGKVENEVHNLISQKEKYQEIKKKIVGEEVTLSDIKHNGKVQDLIESERKYHKILENFYFDEMDSLILEINEEVLKSDASKFLLTRDKPISTPTNQEITKEEGFIAWIKDLFVLKNSKNDKGHLKNGVLVNNLTNALQIFSKYGADVVTLGSEIITSGGLFIRNREKGILNIIEEIRIIEQKIITCINEKNILIKKIEKGKEKQEILRGEVAEKKKILTELETAVMMQRSQMETMQKNRENSLKRIELTQSELELLNINKGKLQGEFETLDNLEQKNEKILEDHEARRSVLLEEISKLREDNNRKEKELLQKENSIRLLQEKSDSLAHQKRGFNNTLEKLGKNIDQNKKEKIKLDQELVSTKDAISNLKLKIKKYNGDKNEKEAVTGKMEKEFSNYNAIIKKESESLSMTRKNLEKIKDEKNEVEINLSSIKKDLFQLEEISFKELNTELKNINPVETLLNLELDVLEEESNSYNERLIKMRDSNRLNFSAESEFELLTKDHQFLLTQKEDVVKSIANMNEAIIKIDNESRESFLKAFAEIRENFLHNFRILFEGGDAELIIMDENNVLETGLEIKAQPPGKKLQSLTLLSGGEKTLTSLAFLFSLFQYKPSPFCVFDEVDASLDEANIQRFLKFLHKLKEKTQFLIITHNFKTMEEADYIYGISMNEPGISTVFSTKMTEKGELEKLRR